MYHEIHKMSRQGHSISDISKYLGINWRTVSKYLKMDEGQYEAFINTSNNRSKGLSQYESFVKIKLEKYPDTSASQMHDWLKEFDEDFPAVNPKTVYNFVMWVRQIHNIPKTKQERDYLIVEELSYGKQAQVDFGEYNMRTSTGGRKKVYFFTMVLSRSRYKYVYFNNTPFTSVQAVNAHEKAFAHFQGIPVEIVYDQDSVFIHDENKGDLLLTETFKSYINQRGFKTYFCRKSDPETKGKVENVVKYVKQNFLYNRSYFDLDTLNDEAIAWLHRTANHQPHGKTKQPPRELWDIEKPHLKPYATMNFKFNETKTYTVRKDNTISYKSNLYTLPQGTWAGNGTKVAVAETDGRLNINDLNGNMICSHPISTGKGKTIFNNDHKRDKTTRINQLIIETAGKFDNPTNAVSFFELIRLEKPRYIRDQIQSINECFGTIRTETLNVALAFCIDKKIYNASDFKAIATKIEQDTTNITIAENAQIKTLPDRQANLDKFTPNTSDIIDYESLMSNKN